VAEVDPPDGVEDMIQLSDLHQGSLLRNIKKRFKAKLIYTYTGSILVAVNPYKLFDIYNLNVVRKYEGQLIGKLPPHIFAIGSAAFSNMIKTREDQCVVISGESGAGKTESTKLIMQYLAAVNKSPSNLTTEQILEANPLLESFGNAKTVRNDNSSRFGKYLEINFGRRGVINGARTTEYLLEKSRIVYQAGGERNYHVFYEMLVGLAPNDKLKYGLLKAENYFYLNQGGACCLEGKDDVNDFLRLVASTEVLGFSHEEKDAIFRILATVLHLGNLCFSMEVRSGQDASVVDSENELQAVSALLMVPSDSFRLSLTHKLTETRGERFRTPLNIERALDTRDALAKALYSKLFSWLVQRVNSIIDRQKKVTSIAVLDIFGFEDFKTNSFEQLCINYANENLQYYFNQHIFKLEQEEYSREQISWETIEFNDNQPCLDLIARKPLGILHILDDESNFPKATDQSFLDKLLQQHEKNSYFEKPKTKKPLFAIHHYAGSVWYTVSMFLDKNRDILRPDLIELLNSSTSPFISSLFAEDYEVVMSSGARKKKTPTVAAKFHQSLTDLISAMQQCHPFFVRCIKPNAEKASMTFENKLVLDQLRYSGMLETIRIRRAGFPVRLKFSAFAKRYQCLAEGLPVNSGDRATCIHVIEKLKDKIGSAHQLGLTKVFLREVAEQKLEEARAIRLRGAAVLIQKHVRGYLARMRYIKLRQAVIVIQRYVATWLARTHFLQMRQNVILVQSYVRMHQQQQRYILIRDAHRREQEELRRIQEEERARRKAMEESSRLIDDHHFSSDQWVPMMDVTSLEIPTELALILDSIARGWRHQHIERGLIAVRDQYETDSFSAAELPGDVDSHAFSKFTGAHFQEGYSWEFQRQPLTQPLTKLCSEKLQLEAVAVFKMIMRFIGDPAVSGSQEVAIGNYIIQKGIMYPELRDEIYSQLACQTYSNNEESSESERGWLLFALCLCAFPPSPLLYKYLLKSVGYFMVTF
jgi:myosin-15